MVRIEHIAAAQKYPHYHEVQFDASGAPVPADNFREISEDCEICIIQKN